MPRHKQINIRKIASNNPRVDVQHLAEVFIFLHELRKSGVQPKGYDLKLPFSKEVQVKPPGEEDPRTVHLGR